MNSRRGFIRRLIDEQITFEEIIRRTHERFPESQFRQKHVQALQSILSQEKRTVPRESGSARTCSAAPAPVVARSPQSSLDSTCGYERESPVDLARIRDELKRRQAILVKLAHDPCVPMDPVERRHIIEYLGGGLLPQKITDEKQLMKEFVSSALSINQPPFRTRSRMKRLLGEIVLANTVPIALNRLFQVNDFLDDSQWTAERLKGLAERLTSEGKDSGDSFKTSVLRTIGSIAHVMQRELSSGIAAFHALVESTIPSDPENVWAFMEDFTRGIAGVGPVLMSDFLKNIGYMEFVKIDQRLKVEFPALLSGIDDKPRVLFVYAWRLCKQIGMTPFVFDHILYQWGNQSLKQYIK